MPDWTPSEAFHLAQILGRLEQLAEQGGRLEVTRWCLWAEAAIEREATP